MTTRTETQSIENDAEPDAVFDLLADPRRIPEWAPDFAEAVTGDARQGWRVTKNCKEFDLRVVAQPSAGTVDYLREIAPGRVGGAYVRALPRPAGGSVIVMTVPVPPNSDRVVIGVTLQRELTALSHLTING